MTYVRKLGVGSWAPLLLSPPLIHTVLVQLSSAVRYSIIERRNKLKHFKVGTVCSYILIYPTLSTNFGNDPASFFDFQYLILKDHII
jgi:hypothetical protein